jgi:hypothetical protein
MGRKHQFLEFTEDMYEQPEHFDALSPPSGLDRSASAPVEIVKGGGGPISPIFERLDQL